VLDYVEQIKNLLQKKDELKKTIDSRDFPRAIQMCLDAQAVAHKYAQFNCVAGMRKIIQVSHIHAL
jgi:SPX domain protein involved in polyphosphate accumulation